MLGLGTAALATPMLLTVAHDAAQEIGPRRAAAPDWLPTGRGSTPEFHGSIGSATLCRLARSLRLGTTQRRHTRGVAGVDFTRDGTAAVTAQDDGLVRFWERRRWTAGSHHRHDGRGATLRIRCSVIHALSRRETDAAAGFAFDPVRQRIVESRMGPRLEDEPAEA